MVEQPMPIRPLLTLLLIFLFTATSSYAAIGDEWTRVRGDQSPGLSYSSFLATSSGRWIAAGRGGRLMISDDDGANWRYDAIVDQNGRKLVGTVTDMVEVNGTIVGTAVSLTPSSNRFGLPFEGLTRIVSSQDNGNTWQVDTFPIREAVSNAGRFPGVYLTNLFVTPAGGLIAYGTALLSNEVIGFSIGGLIYRQAGDTWNQMFYELGRVQSMSQTGSRLAASGFQTVLDSADGGGWNGYRLRDAQISVGGDVLDLDIREGLNGSDITFRNGNYVMQTQLFRRTESDPNIFEAVTVRNFVLQSANPFDGGRNWTGVELNQVYPDWLNLPDRIVSVGSRGAYTSTGGTNWALADESVRSGFGSVGAQDGQTVISVRNSDEVWRSDNQGQSWTKILDDRTFPGLANLVRVGDRILGQGGFGFDTIWSSADNGATWTQLADIGEQTGSFDSISPIRVIGDRLYTAFEESNQILRSDDQGATWDVIDFPMSGNSSGDLLDVVVGQNGRIIIAPESRGIDPPVTDFFTSDDDGATWVPRSAPLGFGETPKTGLHVGGGRIIYLMNSTAVFSPELIISDDNGVTWRREQPFEGLAGLNETVNIPPETVIELDQILRTRAGRLIIRGTSGEILTSDDRGNTWTVRENRDAFRGDGPFLDWTVYPIVESGNRLIAAGSRRDGLFGDDFAIIWISGDDGTTWRTFPLETSLPDTLMEYATVASDGRVVLSGDNAVYISNTPDLTEAPQAAAFVREGETLSLDIPRPPLDGAVRMTYSLSPGTATEDEDYVNATGELVWSESDTSTKLLMVDTIEDSTAEQTEDFIIELGSDGDLIIAFSYLVSITDNEPGEAGLDIITDGPLNTRENGPAKTFRLALGGEPADDVTVTLENGNVSEVVAQPTSFTFTASNWNVPQVISLLPQDDEVADRDVAVALTLTPASADEDYDGLMPVTVYVTNLDDDDNIFSDNFQ